MNANLLSGMPTNTPGTNEAGTALNLSGELRRTLAEWTFLLGRADDASWLESQGLNAVEWTRGDLGPWVRGRKLILVAPDAGESERFARQLADAVRASRLATHCVWVLAGLGSRSGSLREWCEENDFSAALARDRPWEPAEKPGAGAASSAASPRAQPPRFTSDPRPINVELLPVPRLDDLLIPASLRGWVADIADRGGFPLEYPAAAAIVGLSGLIGRRIALRPKRADDWLVVPNLWGAVVGPPGIQLLEAHACRIYQAAMDGDLDAAVHLGERIKTSLPNPFTYRTVFHKGWSGLTTADEVRQAVGILQDRGWVKTAEVPSSNTRGGRPAELVWIHPTLLKPQVPGTFHVD
jgi:hypothetical protein